jgi:hypothetical protein
MPYRVFVGIGVGLVTACAGPQLRIDGSSDSAFDSSRAALIGSLTPEQRLRFLLAEVVYLEPFGCLKPHASTNWLGNTLSEIEGRDLEVSSRRCRAQLDGKTYSDVIRLAKRSPPVKVGFVAEPAKQ